MTLEIIGYFPSSNLKHWAPPSHKPYCSIINATSSGRYLKVNKGLRSVRPQSCMEVQIMGRGANSNDVPATSLREHLELPLYLSNKRLLFITINTTRIKELLAH